jgi:hypothetical protein
VFSIFLFLFSDRNASDCMIQTFLLYRANVKSEIRNVSGICKIASAHRFYRNLIATASKSSYNSRYFLLIYESGAENHDV